MQLPKGLLRFLPSRRIPAAKTVKKTSRLAMLNRLHARMALLQRELEQAEESDLELGDFTPDDFTP